MANTILAGSAQETSFVLVLPTHPGPFCYYWRALASPNVRMLGVTHCAFCVSGSFRPVAQRLCIAGVYKRRKKGARRGTWINSSSRG